MDQHGVGDGMRFFFAAMLLLLLVPAVARAEAPSVRVARVARSSGDGDPMALRRTLHASTAMLRACLERRLARGARIEGRLDLTVVIAPSGQPSSVAVERRTFAHDTQLEGCMFVAVRRGRIPRAAGPSTFAITLLLAAGDSAAAGAATPPADEAAAMRAEIAQARTDSRCLSRAASTLARLLAEWERAGPPRRARLVPAIAQARGAAALCRAGGMLGLLRGAAVQNGTGFERGCSGCLLGSSR